jgi:hypothetical protein
MSIKLKRNIGIGLFILGSIIAISAAAKMPPGTGTDGKFPDTVGPFVFAFILGIIGNILWHKSEKAITMLELEENKGEGDSNPLTLLKATIAQLEELEQISKEKEGMEFCEKVDEVLDNYVHPFTEKRKTFVDILGQLKGSEILLTVAYGERMLNRVWSAASDGHMEEARNSLEESLFNYKKAVAKL